MSSKMAMRLVKPSLLTRMRLNEHLFSEERRTPQEIEVERLGKVLQQSPQDWKHRLVLADLLYELDCLDQSVKEYCRVLAQQPQLQSVWLKLGQILQQMARGPEAIAVYQRALTLTDSPLPQLQIMGAIATCQNLPQTAAHAFEAATKLDPQNPDLWMALGQAHQAREDPVAALQAFEQFLWLKPDNILGLTYSYEALVALGNWREAGWRTERVLALDPCNIKALRNLADARSRRGLVWGEEGKRTRQLIHAALRLAPQDPRSQLSLAYYRIFRRESDKGIAALKQFVDAHPERADGWYCYARCLFHTGHVLEAAQAILKAHLLGKKDCDFYRTACEILPFAGSVDPLQSLLFEMLDRFPGQWSVWATAGKVLVETFQENEQGCVFSALGKQLRPHLAQAWFQYGRVLMLAGQHEQAVSVLKQGWEQLPNEEHLEAVSAAVWLAETYLALEDPTNSKFWWKVAHQKSHDLIEFSPAQAYYWQGKTLAGLGCETAAVQAYGTALGQQLLYPLRGKVEEIVDCQPISTQSGVRV